MEVSTKGMYRLHNEDEIFEVNYNYRIIKKL